MAALAIAINIDHLALDARCPLLLAHAAQHGSVAGCIEMKGVVGRTAVAVPHTPGAAQAGLEAEGVQFRLLGQRACAQPEVVELRRPGVGAVGRERMKVTLTQPAPVLELDAKLVGAAG